MKKEGCVYIMASISKTLYIGVTSDLIGRVWEHKNKAYKGFTQTYQCNKLVYFETWNTIEDAINREKQLKDWRRDWKLRLIERKSKIQ